MKKSLTNNIGLKLLAFLFAFMLWLLVVNIDDPVDTKTFDSIPVTIEHAEVVTQDQRSYQVLDGNRHSRRDCICHKVCIGEDQCGEYRGYR